ncbi:hypothetical protein EDB87DRAFT_1602408 [Lactarius vividus]|nr:hypothetical protein EDB87DRAFT_1602408 [Lactarius vividus]
MFSLFTPVLIHTALLTWILHVIGPQNCCKQPRPGVDCDLIVIFVMTLVLYGRTHLCGPHDMTSISLM